MGKKNDKDNKKFYWFKIDKDKVKLQLKDIGNKFIPRKKNWRNISIAICSLILLGIIITVYTGNLNNDKESNRITPEITIDHKLENNQEEKSSTPAVVYQKDNKFDLSAGELQLDKKNSEKNLIKNEKKYSSPRDNLVKKEAEKTFPVGPVPTQKRVNDSFQIVKPLAGSLGSKAGWFYHPVFEDWRYRPGIIIDGERGKIARAAADGKIISIEQDVYYGIKVILQHEHGWQSVYGNLTQSNISTGDSILTGDELGRIGKKGLYFELRKKERAVDPLHFLNLE